MRALHKDVLSLLSGYTWLVLSIDDWATAILATDIARQRLGGLADVETTGRQKWSVRYDANTRGMAGGHGRFVEYYIRTQNVERILLWANTGR